MIKFILLFIVLASFLFFGSAWVGEKGYVLIALGHWTIEASVVSAAFILLVAYFALHITVVAVISFFKVRKYNRAWRDKRRQKKSFSKFEAALEALFCNEYTTAEKLSTESAESSPIRKAHYLIAAESARAQGKFEQHAQYSLRAVEQGSETEKQLAIVQNLKEEGKLEHAIERAEDLLKKEPHQSQTLVLLAMLYKDANQHQALADLLKQVKKYTQLPAPVFNTLLSFAYQGIYTDAANQKALKLINKAHNVVKKLADNVSELDHLYVNALVQGGFDTEAEKYLLKITKSTISVEVLNTIKHARLQQPTKLISHLEHAIKQHPDRTMLVTALGYVAAAARDWSLAQKALETALRAQPSVDDYHKLAFVFEQLNQPQHALSCYKKAIEL